VAGTPGKTGAAILAGAAALRSGAGLVTVGTHPECVHAIATVQWELMAAPLLPARPNLTHDAARGVLRKIDDAIANADVVAVGPGLGDTSSSRHVVHHLIDTIHAPLVLDADALNVLAGDPEYLKRASAPVVITPHPGEMARLLATSTANVLGDRLTCARHFAATYNVITLLKSGSTVIAHPDGRFAINTSGTPGMASAGMGDVLTGLIASFIGQRLDPWHATCLAAFLHGRAGERGVEEVGERALTARVLLDML